MEEEAVEMDDTKETVFQIQQDSWREWQHAQGPHGARQMGSQR